jgi:hypothetical protein
MQIEQWPAYGTSEFLSAYRLDATGQHDLVTGTTAPPDAPASSVSKVWGAAASIAGARSMILRTADRAWIAAGAVLVEGRAGLNMGLVMPSIRALPEVAAPPVPGPARFDDALQRTLWDIAVRLDRIEDARVMQFRAGADFALHVDRTGFVMLDGATVKDFLAGIRKTVSGKRRVSYTLAAARDEVSGQRHTTAMLFGKAERRDDLRLAADGWPDRIPQDIGFDRLALVMALVQRLESAVSKEGARLTVIDAGARQLLSAVRDLQGWTVNQLPSGV